MDKAQQRMIARRVSKGNALEQSRTLLAELLESHEGDNLAHALAYNGFATEAGAARYVAQVA